MATLEQFKKEESALYKRIYRDVLKDSISSFLDSQNRKIASAVEGYIAELTRIYGEHFAKDTIFGGEMMTKNVAKRIEASLSEMKVINQTTGVLEPKFYSLMELCKYPVALLEKNANIPGYDIKQAVSDALQEVEGLIEEYYKNHETKNQQFNWDGYVRAYHNVINKIIDQAVRGNDYVALLGSLETLNDYKSFMGSDDQYALLKSVRMAYNNSTGFSNMSGTKESTGVYKFNTEQFIKSLYMSQIHLAQLAHRLQDGQEKLKLKMQIDFVERVIDIMCLAKGDANTELIRFFSKTDRLDMVAQFLENMGEDWDIVGSLSNTQFKKIMRDIDNYQTTKAYMAIKSKLMQYVLENHANYIAEHESDPSLLVQKMMELANFCESLTVSQILKYGKGISDAQFKSIFEEMAQDRSVSVVDVIPAEIQRQLVTSMANKNLLNNRILFNAWKHSTENYIALNDMLEQNNGISENFEAEHNIPKSVAMSILWENVLGLNRIKYYMRDEKFSQALSGLIEEIEGDGIYADWSNKNVFETIWQGRTFEQELTRIKSAYGRVLPMIGEKTVNY